MIGGNAEIRLKKDLHILYKNSLQFFTAKLTNIYDNRSNCEWIDMYKYFIHRYILQFVWAFVYEMSYYEEQWKKKKEKSLWWFSERARATEQDIHIICIWYIGFAKCTHIFYYYWQKGVTR